MKRLSVYLLLIALGVAYAVPSHAVAWTSINFDEKLVEAMTATFADEAVTEGLYREATSYILNHYTAAEVASAGIFASKYMERQAMKKAGIFGEESKNYYYQRIYNMVKNKIMPKALTVVKLMLQSPQTAIYWAPYIMKTLDDVKALCMQFESAVTNCSLTFSDITFLDFVPELRAIIDFANSSDWSVKNFFDSFASGDYGQGEMNMTSLIDEIARLATAIVGGSTGDSGFTGVITNASNTITNYSSMMTTLEPVTTQSLTNFLSSNSNDSSGLFVEGTYNISDWLKDYASEAQGQYYTQRFYIYDDNNNVVYETVFDSYSMDYDAFYTQLTIKLDAYEQNQEYGAGDYIDVAKMNYYIGSDEKMVYLATSAEKMAGIDQVTFNVECKDTVEIAKNTTQYKCGTCTSSLTAHTKECSMKTSVDEEEFNTSELEASLAAVNVQIASLQSEIAGYESQMSDLLTKIADSSYSIAEAEEFREEYNALFSTVTSLRSDLSELTALQSGYEDAIKELEDGESVATDDIYRIPAIMRDCVTSFGVSWTSDGYWDDYTYCRYGTEGNIEGSIKFTAELSIARPPKYFLWFKIHRAIVAIEWKLSGLMENSFIADIMQFDSGTSDEEKANQVNAKLSELALEFPDCAISADYTSSESQDEGDTDNQSHLLWASDRMELAREIDSRITKIYADLVLLERFMHYKKNFLSILKEAARGIDTEAGRKRTTVEECHKRWRDNGRSVSVKVV